jgi:hypothetical protein
MGVEDDIEELDATPAHPRIRARRAEVEDQSQRSRQRKLIAFAIILVVLLLAAASTQSALFDVDEVRVVGTARTSPEYLREVAGVDLGTALLGLDTAAIEERLLELPEVDTVSASASWRGVVTVEINERVPVARIESSAGTVVVADDGIVLEIIERTVVDSSVVEAATSPGVDPDTPIEFVPLPPEVEALPEIAGAIFVTERGKQIPTVLEDALIVATILPDDIAVITERVEITVDSLVLKVVGGGLISLGDSRDLAEKFDAVRAFLAQVDLSCLDTLNVRAPSVPVIRRNSNC